MATTYGIDFPFRNSLYGDYLRMTENEDEEVRANLIHLLLTKKGSRYFLPDFGTRLYEYIFDQNDITTFGQIEDEIRESVKKYIPNLDINSIKVTNAEEDPESLTSISEDEDTRLFRSGTASTKPYTAKIRIDYTVNNGAFGSSDFVIINV
jgi:phage baseplate assembly protein W